MQKRLKFVSLLIILTIYGCNNTPNSISNKKVITSISPSDSILNPTIIPTVLESIISTPSTSTVYKPVNEIKFTPENSEFKIGKTRDTFESNVSTILNDDGSSITTWAVVEVSGINIYVQKYNKDFKPDGDEIKVNTVSIPANENAFYGLIKVMFIAPKIILDNDNGFIISWTNNGKLYLRKFDSNGYAAKPELNPKINIKGLEIGIPGVMRGRNTIIPDKNGTYFVIGSGYLSEDNSSGFAQLYDKDFKPINDLIRLYSESEGNICADKDKQGNILLLFWKYDRDANSSALYGQRYKADASRLGYPFKMKDISGLNSFSMNTEGNFIFSGENKNNTVFNREVYFQKYNSDNNLVNIGPVNTKDIKFSSSPITEVSMNDNGDFVIVWGEHSFDYLIGDIYARKYDKDGQPKGEEFKVNYLSKGFKANPTVSLNNNGDFLIAWSNWNDNQNSYNIYARKYNINENLPNDDPSLIPDEIVDCQPNETQFNEIKNQQSYTGELKIKVKDNGKIIGLKSKEDFERISKNIKSESGLLEISINGKPFNYSGFDLIAKLSKTGCFEQIFAKYGIKNNNSSSGFYYINTDNAKYPVDKFEQLLRQFIIRKKLQVNEIEFSSTRALADFALYMELELNYSYLFQELYFEPILTTDA